MQAGLGDVIAVAGGADGRNVADMLDHRRERKRHDGDDGGNRDSGVEAVAEEGEDRVVPEHGKADPRSVGDAREVHLPHRSGDEIRHDDA